MTDAAPRTAERRRFLDVLRGAAVVLMVVNHTARWWMDPPMTWSRYRLIYVTMALGAPIFLLLVGYGLALSFEAAARAGRSCAATASRTVIRGARIVLAGVLLNALAFREEPVWAGGVLQTIGFSVMLLAPGVWLVRSAWARRGLVLAALVIYLSFVRVFPDLGEWVRAHPDFSRMWFYEFPLWPWFALPMIGLALGSAEAGESVERRGRFFARLAVAGACAAVAAVGYGWLTGTGPHLQIRLDLVLNRHWTPRPVMAMWALGALAGLLAVAWYVVERRERCPRWLLVLGQAALMIYFVHHFIVLTLVKQALGLAASAWTAYWVANVVLVVLLVGLAHVWLSLRGPLKQGLSARLARGRTA